MEKITLRQQIVEDMGLSFEDFRSIDPADFELAAWPNSYKDFEVPSVPCLLCGHALRYAAGYRHKPSGELFHVGQDCEVYIDSANKGEMYFLKLRTAAKNRAAEIEREAEWVRKNDGFKKDKPEVVRFLESIDEHKDPFIFLRDMVSAYKQYGSLTERQTAAVEKILVKRQEQEKKMREEFPVPTGPAPEGRQTVTGTILFQKWYDSDFYDSVHKMLVVLEDGNKVFGSVPRSLEDWVTDTMQKRDRSQDGSVNYEQVMSEMYKQKIRFSANFTQKDGDPNFAYYKRPTKLEVL